MGFFRTLLGMLKPKSTEAEAVVDALLLASALEGPIDQSCLDRIGRSLSETEELSGYEWSAVLERKGVVERDAPTFQRTKSSIRARLENPRMRRFALALAAQAARATEVPRLGQDTPKSLLELARILEIEGNERDDLVDPWTAADPLASTYTRLSFNAPSSCDDETLDEALAHYASNSELGLLVFKLLAPRLAASVLGADAEVQAVGEIIDLDGEPIRVDALILSSKIHRIARFLGPGEALNAVEHGSFERLLARLKEGAGLFFGHAGPLSPSDQAFLERLGSDRVQTAMLRL